MRGVVCACVVGMRNGALVLDPREKEETGGFAFTFEGEKAGEVVWAEWAGEDTDWEEVVQEAERAAGAVKNFLRAEFEKAAGLVRDSDTTVDVKMG